MEFVKGQTVVHPHHGPATITDVTTRSIRNVPKRYLTLDVHRTTLTISVPVAGAEEIGLRPVLDTAGLRELFDVLRAPTTHEEQGWSRRLKDNQERLRTGDLLVTSGVVRDMTRRLDERGLSFGEKDLLKEARRHLVAELAVSLGVTDERAGDMVDAAVLRGEEPALGVELARAG
ncbi:CarD family transcriptional regulator [Georgenia sp. SYP-B2076]|uniref:CarD family transcriptional regulator n=1 Tax=Georgenia sp. SYP-B2076 TaxID=2495881 RepID=UPI000F8E07B7|nr:CarD family transcriptional regulator [Georgenia sp. SYP-B2076]